VSTGCVVLALLVLVSSCAAQDRANPHTNTPGGTPEHEVRAALSDLGDAVHHQDFDEIVAFFAPDYASQEATGKSAVREWWARVISTPQPYLDFRLERGDHGAWLITGIPSESR
jgi:hypothetical protein